MNDLTILQTLFARWSAKSSTFYKWVGYVSAVVTFVTGIPELLSVLGVVLPEPFLSLENKVVLAAAGIALLLSKFSVGTPAATNRVLSKISTGVSPADAAKGE